MNSSELIKSNKLVIPEVLTVVGDLHIQPTNLELHEKLFKQLEDFGLDVVLLGDVFHTKEIIRGRCLNFLLDKIKGSKLHFYVLAGNHDQFNTSSYDSSVDALAILPNVTVINKPTVFYTSQGKVAFSAIPYIHDKEKFLKVLEEVRSVNTGLLFLHQGINTFDYGNGIIEKDGISPEVFRPFSLVISGHFHKYANKNNIVYLGTPFSHDFGEANQDKYLGVLNLSTAKLDTIKTHYRQHQRIVVRDQESLDRMLETLSADHHYKIILEMPQEQMYKIKLRQTKLNITYVRKLIDCKLEKSYLYTKDTPQENFKEWAEKEKRYSAGLVSLGLSVLNGL